MAVRSYITDLRLQHFRSYSDASFEIDPGVNIIVGPNASGKTNLLEAVLMLARGGSYRAKDSELVQFGEDWARLDADLPDGKRSLKFQHKPSFQKTFIIDEQSYSRLTHPKTLPIVLFEPNHLLLFSGSPELRRTFLDDLIEQTQPNFGAIRRHYKRVVAQRNSLLKKNPKNIAEQLFVWNLRLSELGGKIARERAMLIERFGKVVSALYNELAHDHSTIQLEYQSPFAVDLYETSLLKKLEASTELDILRGFTAYGPHRDDLGMSINGHAVQEAASRGETRTMVLVLKLLELQLLEETRHIPPLLLLDDVFSELDSRRRQALTTFVAHHQTFITTTDADMVLAHFTSSTIIPTKS